MRNKKALVGLLVGGMLLSALAVSALAAPGDSYTGSPTTVNLTFNDDTGLFEWTDPDTGDVYTYTYDPATNTFTRNTEIEDEDVPLAEIPDLNEEIPNYTPYYVEIITIEDEETPLAALPPFVVDLGPITDIEKISNEGTTKIILAGDELVVSTDGSGDVRYEEREDEEGEKFNVIVYDLTTEDGTDTEADLTISEHALAEWGKANEPVELQLDFGTVTLQPETSSELSRYLGNVRMLLTKNEEDEASAILAMLGEEPEPYTITILNVDGDSFDVVKDEGDEDSVEEIDENAYQVTVYDPENDGEEITIHGFTIELKEEVEG